MTGCNRRASSACDVTNGLTSSSNNVNGSVLAPSQHTASHILDLTDLAHNNPSPEAQHDPAAPHGEGTVELSHSVAVQQERIAKLEEQLAAITVSQGKLGHAPLQSPQASTEIEDFLAGLCSPISARLSNTPSPNRIGQRISSGVGHGSPSVSVQVVDFLAGLGSVSRSEADSPTATASSQASDHPCTTTTPAPPQPQH